ncbi:hypothetical protein PJI18_09565 [Mycobacterium kansasii]
MKATDCQGIRAGLLEVEVCDINEHRDLTLDCPVTSNHRDFPRPALAVAAGGLGVQEDKWAHVRFLRSKRALSWRP